MLRAAAELFSERGYAATSISAICKASGVVPSSIYWVFGNKAGVFAAFYIYCNLIESLTSNRGSSLKSIEYHFKGVHT